MFYQGAPVGLHPVRNILNASPNFATRHFPIDPDATDDIFQGTPLTLTGTSDDRGQPYVRVAQPGDTLIGATVGFSWQDYNLRDFPHYKAGCDCHAEAIIAEGASTVYSVWVPLADDAEAATLVGEKNIDFTVESQTAGKSASNVVADVATVGTGAALPLKLLRRIRSPWSNLDATACGGDKGQYWEVMINAHLHDSTTEGV